MKNHSLFFLVFILAVGVPLHGQSAFISALKINDAITEYNRIKADSKQAADPAIQAANLNIQLDNVVKEILIFRGGKPYPFGSQSYLKNISAQGSNTYNPFFSRIAFFMAFKDISIQKSLFQIDAGSSSTLSSSGLSVNTVATGISQFLIERAQQELIISFLEEFNRALTEFPELGVLFPKTKEYLVTASSNPRYDRNFLSFQSFFQDDLVMMPGTIVNLGTDQSVIALSSPQAKIRWKMYDAFWKTEQGGWIKLMLGISSGLLQGKPLLYLLKETADQISSSNGNLKDTAVLSNFMKLVALIGESLQTGDQTWIDEKQIAHLYSDDQLARLFFGLIYEQAKNLDIDFIDQKVLENLADKVDVLLSRMRPLIQAFCQLGNVLKEWDGAVNDLEKRARIFAAYAKQIGELFDEETMGSLCKLMGLDSDVTARVKTLGSWIQAGSDIVDAVQRQDYPVIFVRSFSLIRQILDYYRISPSKILETQEGEFLRIKAIIGNPAISDPDFKKYLGSIFPSAKISFTNASGMIDAINSDIAGLGFDQDKKDFSAISDKVNAITTILDEAEKTLDNGARQDCLAGLDKAMEAIKAARSSFSDAKGDIAKGLQDYGASITSILGIIETYGPFLAAISNAHDADEVKNLLAVYAAPATSYQLKYQSKFSIAFNSYVGGIGGWRPLSEFDAGIYAPLGVSFSWSQNPNRVGGGSFTVFAGLFDLGGVTAVQLSGGTTTLPELSIANLLAPGVYFVYGFGRTPISVGIGTQFGPGFRSDSSGVVSVTNYAWRGIALFLAIDVPIFVMYMEP